MFNSHKPKSVLPWLALSAFLIILDQCIKWLVIKHLAYQQILPVFPSINLFLVFNTGAAYGFLGGAGGWQVYFFCALAMIAALIFIVWLVRSPRHMISRSLGLSLIIAGALGNVIDRIRLSYVIDYIDFYVGKWHFATFNFADACITVGAFFLILSLLQTKKN